MNNTSGLPSIATLDIGTTSAKGLLVLTNGNTLASQQCFYETSFPGPGFAEQDPDSIYEGVLQVLQTITSTDRPSGICVSSAMHSIMAVDQSGKPLTRLMIWSDTRSTDQSQYLITEKIAPELYSITGTPVHPMSPLCKLLWLKHHQPRIFESAYKFISIKEYVLFRLTGEFIVDHSIASATGLFDLDRRRWSALSLSLLGLAEERFSRPVSVYSTVNIKKEIAATLRLDEVPIVIGASDGCLAQLGSHAMKKDDLSITIGTSGAVRVASPCRAIDPQGRIFNYILDDTIFVCGGATNNGAGLLHWYSKNMDSDASQDLAEFVNQTLEIPPGCEGLLMLPYLLGERAPIYNPKARGVFFGVSIDHNKKHFQRALIEGICLEIRWIVECVEEFLGKRKHILISGGFTRSESWVQILCDILGRNLAVQEPHDASSMGAAMMGFKALGIQSEFTVHRLPKVFNPNVHTNGIYSASYQKFRSLYAAIEKLY